MATFAPDEKMAEMGTTGRPPSEHQRKRTKSFESDGSSLYSAQLNPDEFMLNNCNYRDDSVFQQPPYPLGTDADQNSML